MILLGLTYPQFDDDFTNAFLGMKKEEFPLPKVWRETSKRGFLMSSEVTAKEVFYRAKAKRKRLFRGNFGNLRRTGRGGVLCKSGIRVGTIPAGP